MTVERREFEERTPSDGGVYDVDQKLQSYLRDKYSAETLNDPNIRADAIRLLSSVAQDWCYRHKRPCDNPIKIADDNIDNFIKNWQNKKQGVDDRSHAFGRINSK